MGTNQKRLVITVKPLIIPAPLTFPQIVPAVAPKMVVSLTKTAILVLFGTFWGII